MTQQEIILTRPRLVADLAGKGIHTYKRINPWDSSRIAWSVPLTPISATIICDYYEKCGKRPPQMVVEYLERGDC